MASITCSGTTKVGLGCRKYPTPGTSFCHLHTENSNRIFIVDVVGDGFCFWRAASVCLYKRQGNYQQLLSLVLSKKDAEDIVSRVFVEFHEVPIISKCLNKSITIYTKLDDLQSYYTVYKCYPDGNIIFEQSNNINKEADINILHGNLHYQAIM